MFSRPPRNRSHRSTDGNSLEPAIGDTTVGLEPGQILVLDNLRVLHGREAFEAQGIPVETRKLRRVWIGNDLAPALRNAEGAIPSHRGLAPYVPYRVRSSSVSPPERIQVKGGLRLSDDAMAVAESLLSEIGTAPRQW